MQKNAWTYTMAGTVFAAVAVMLHWLQVQKIFDPETGLPTLHAPITTLLVVVLVLVAAALWWLSGRMKTDCAPEEPEDALALPPSEWPDVDGGAARRHESQSASAPKSIRVWKERYPERLQVLNRARKAVSQIAEDTRTPVEIVIKPQYLRNLCWTDEPRKRDVARFLSEQGARDWQVSLVAESVSRAIM